MFLVRLFAVVLFISSISAIGQEQQSQSQTPRDNSTQAAKAWIIKPGQPQTGAGTRDALKGLADGKLQFKLDGQGSALLADQSASKKFLVIPLQTDDVVLPGDEICYTMRSYVLARDSKDSDATHPVKSSTCQMASRYRVKTIAPADVAPVDEAER